MNLPDTNVWIALTLSKHVFHESARNWFEQQSRAGSVLFCRSTQQSLLRLITTDSVLKPYGIPPMANAEAWEVYDGFLADSRVAFASEPRNLDPRWKSFASRKTASPKLWMDAYLAAFAVEGGHKLITTDQGFAQFKGLELAILSKGIFP